MRAVPPSVFLLVALFLPASAAAQALPQVPLEFARIRAALEKYQDPFVAVHDGYFSTVGCVTYPKAGGPGEMQYVAGTMGVHFFNAALIGPTVDPMRPQVLMYLPEGDKLRLVAAEWFVPLAVGVTERPNLLGRPFDGPMEGHHPLMPVEMAHYDLHVWLWRDNPAGLLSPTNPGITCPKGGYTIEEVAPKIVRHP
jgi:hypothetical protein